MPRLQLKCYYTKVKKSSKIFFVMNKNSISELYRFFSAERLSSYGKNLSFEEQLKNYNYNIDLCKAFYSSLNYFEICFRNSIDLSLTDFVGNGDWLDILPLDNKGKSKIEEAKQHIKKNNHKISHDRIVAELTLGFWTTLFSKKCSQFAFQGHLVKTVFPNFSKKEKNIKLIQKRIDAIRDLRNRICHYERIFHFPDLQKRHDDLLFCIRGMSEEMFLQASEIDFFRFLFHKAFLKIFIARFFQKMELNEIIIGGKIEKLSLVKS